MELVVGAALCAGMPFDQVRRRAMGIRRKDVAPFDPLVFVMGCSPQSLSASALAAPSPPSSQTRFAVPENSLTVTATDLDSGELWLWGPERPGHRARGRALRIVRPASISPLEADGRRSGTAGQSGCCRSNRAPIVKDADCSSPVDVGPGSTSEEPSTNGDGRSRRRPRAGALPRVVRMHAKLCGS